MTLNRVLDALDYSGPRDRGRYKIACPAHDDDKPSLSVGIGDDGRVLLHCQAGCKPDAVLAAMRLTWDDLAPEGRTNGTASHPAKIAKRIVAEYNYRASDGRLVYQVVRFEPKDFRQRRPDGRGDWEWNIKGIEPVPYRLPELVKADPTMWVYVVEGERDVDNLTCLELVATCNAMGAGKWRGEYDQHFSGRRVCILADNDDPGRDHARQVAEHLSKVATIVRVVELPGLPPKGDVSDWLSAGGTREELARLVDAAPIWTPDTPDDRGSSIAGDETPDGADTFPYCVQQGRLTFVKVAKGRDGTRELTYISIADFEARIVGEICDETGDKLFVIRGHGIRGGDFEIELPSAEFGDTGKLINRLEAISARDTIHVDGRRHVGPAIKKLTGDCWRRRRYMRTGWADNRFLIPGREADDVRIELNRKLAYAIDPNADLGLGLDALVNVIRAPGPERGTVLIAHILLPPMALPAGWRNERAGIFLVGRSGTFKTTTVQIAMTLYGADFVRDDLLVRWGEGSTRNALLAMAAAAHDMPFLIDNYKPSTGDGAHGFINLAHAIMEGGEKERLNRSSELRNAKPIFAWPIFTGEDVPDTDPASLARFLVIRFEVNGTVENPHLSAAQANAVHLSAVGGAWLTWLESTAGREQARLAGEAMPYRRDQWARHLRKIAPDMVNIHRVATNLAINELGMEVAIKHPQLGAVLSPYLDAHSAGLREIAGRMGNLTAQSLEAVRYLRALRELLGTGRAVLRTNDIAAANKWGAKTRKEIERDKLQSRIIGWADGDGGAYLYPDAARQAVGQLLGDNLGGISNNTLFEQLTGLRAIHPGKDRSTVLKRLDGQVQRVLHLRPTALGVGGKDDDGV